MDARGWDRLDVLLVGGDAYVDHPSFGVALLGRVLEAAGFRVGIVAQPRWTDPADVSALGRPRLFAGVTAGALDSMLAHYTAFRKKRRDDAYTPGGEAGARPNRATIVYTGLLKQAFPGLPVVLGGIEASLRRTSHYDFWSNRIRRAVLLDAKADLLVYGMAERAIVDVARAIAAGEPARGIPGTAWMGSGDDLPADGARVLRLPSHETIVDEPAALVEATLRVEQQVQDGGAWATQEVGGRTLVVAPPAAPLSTADLDALYELPFRRGPHPAYREPIPAVEMIRFSVTSHRGCAGGCSFCSLAAHQGRRIRSRSAASLEREVASLTAHPDWTGSLSDVGGPSANMWGARCTADPATCERASCLAPRRCRHFEAPQADQAELLHKLAATPGVRHLRVSSGVRHDLALDDPAYVRALVGHFTGGQLKLAPEHVCEDVLRLMRKPGPRTFTDFLTRFAEESARADKEQYVVPYLMSAFPGCTDADMAALARWLRQRGWRPRQVQCFVPTPGTVATAMFHAGVDPRGRPLHVARTDAARQRQHRILLGEPPRRPQPPGKRRR